VTATDRLGMCTAGLMADPLAPTAESVRGAFAATADAGLSAASVWGWHLPFLTDAGTLVAASAALDGLGIHVAVVEAATAWSAGTTDAVRSEAAQLAAAVEAVGASSVLAVCLEPVLAEPERAREHLAVLAEATGRVGAGVCVEFLPWSGVATLAAAWELVAPLGPAVGIVLDTWHWQRQPGGGDLGLLASIPAERFPFVQLSDAPAAPVGDLMTETMQGRLLPGDGAIDFTAPLRCLEGIGARPFVALEIFNPALVSTLGVAAAAVAMRAAADRVLAVV